MLQPNLNTISLVKNNIYPYLRISYFHVLKTPAKKAKNKTKQNKKKKKGKRKKTLENLNITSLKILSWFML